MTNSYEVKLKRTLTPQGILIDGTWYNSAGLQTLATRLRISWPREDLSIRMDLLKPDCIHVWDPHRDLWFEVPSTKFLRLATHREIEDAVRDAYARILRS